MSGVGESDYITPVLKTLHWLPIEQRITCKVLCLTCKSLSGLAPPYLHSILAPYQPSRSLSAKDQGLLSVPIMWHKTLSSRDFSSVAPTLSNTIPTKIRLAPKFTCFKSRLKTYLFTTPIICGVLIYFAQVFYFRYLNWQAPLSSFWKGHYTNLHYYYYQVVSCRVWY